MSHVTVTDKLQTVLYPPPSVSLTTHPPSPPTLLQAVQGIWARDLDDATSAAINHKYRLLAYGRER